MLQQAEENLQGKAKELTGSTSGTSQENQCAASVEDALALDFINAGNVVLGKLNDAFPENEFLIALIEDFKSFYNNNLENLTKSFSLAQKDGAAPLINTLLSKELQNFSAKLSSRLIEFSNTLCQCSYPALNAQGALLKQQLIALNKSAQNIFAEFRDETVEEAAILQMTEKHGAGLGALSLISSEFPIIAKREQKNDFLKETLKSNYEKAFRLVTNILQFDLSREPNRAEIIDKLYGLWEGKEKENTDSANPIAPIDFIARLKKTLSEKEAIIVYLKKEFGADYKEAYRLMGEIFTLDSLCKKVNGSNDYVAVLGLLKDTKASLKNISDQMLREKILNGLKKYIEYARKNWPITEGEQRDLSDYSRHTLILLMESSVATLSVELEQKRKAALAIHEQKVQRLKEVFGDDYDGAYRPDGGAFSIMKNIMGLRRYQGLVASHPELASEMVSHLKAIYERITDEEVVNALDVFVQDYLDIKSDLTINEQARDRIEALVVGQVKELIEKEQIVGQDEPRKWLLSCLYHEKDEILRQIDEATKDKSFTGKLLNVLKTMPEFQMGTMAGDVAGGVPETSKFFGSMAFAGWLGTFVNFTTSYPYVSVSASTTLVAWRLEAICSRLYGATIHAGHLLGYNDVDAVIHSKQADRFMAGAFAVGLSMLAGAPIMPALAAYALVSGVSDAMSSLRISERIGSYFGWQPAKIRFFGTVLELGVRMSLSHYRVGETVCNSVSSVVCDKASQAKDAVLSYFFLPPKASEAREVAAAVTEEAVAAAGWGWGEDSLEEAQKAAGAVQAPT
jgi:hypothetical protein